MDTTDEMKPDPTNNSADEYGSRVPNSILAELLKESVLHFPPQDFAWGVRRVALREAVTARSGTADDGHEAIPGTYIIENAAQRYFALLDHGRESMKEMFSESEFGVMLNTTCGPLWEWDPWMSVAEMVSDDNGMVNSGKQSQCSELQILWKKLRALTPLQDVALVDVCERVWRDKSHKPLSEKLTDAGIALAV